MGAAGEHGGRVTLPAAPPLDLSLGRCLEQGEVTSHASQALQQHYHPEVSQAASVINQALSVPEVSIAPLLELTAFEVRAGGTLGPGWLGCRDLAVRACHLSVSCRCSSGT